MQLSGFDCSDGRHSYVTVRTAKADTCVPSMVQTVSGAAGLSEHG